MSNFDGFHHLPIEVTEIVLSFDCSRNGINAQVCREWYHIIKRFDPLLKNQVRIVFESESLMKFFPFYPSDQEMIKALKTGINFDAIIQNFPISSKILFWLAKNDKLIELEQAIETFEPYVIKRYKGTNRLDHLFDTSPVAWVFLPIYALTHCNLATFQLCYQKMDFFVPNENSTPKLSKLEKLNFLFQKIHILNFIQIDKLMCRSSVKHFVINFNYLCSLEGNDKLCNICITIRKILQSNVTFKVDLEPNVEEIKKNMKLLLDQGFQFKQFYHGLLTACVKNPMVFPILIKCINGNRDNFIIRYLSDCFGAQVPFYGKLMKDHEGLFPYHRRCRSFLTTDENNLEFCKQLISLYNITKFSDLKLYIFKYFIHVFETQLVDIDSFLSLIFDSFNYLDHVDDYRNSISFTFPVFDWIFHHYRDFLKLPSIHVIERAKQFLLEHTHLESQYFYLMNKIMNEDSVFTKIFPKVVIYDHLNFDSELIRHLCPSGGIHYPVLLTKKDELKINFWNAMHLNVSLEESFEKIKTLDEYELLLRQNSKILSFARQINTETDSDSFVIYQLQNRVPFDRNKMRKWAKQKRCYYLIPQVCGHDQIRQKSKLMKFALKHYNISIKKYFQ
jgi:hypothetical protein